jgi:hypothetical protein
MHAIMCQPRAMAFWSSPPHDSAEQTLDWLMNMAAIPPRSAYLGGWVLPKQTTQRAHCKWAIIGATAFT